MKNFLNNFTHKFLFLCYLLVMVILVSLYKFLPVSPILLIPNTQISDWPYEPVSCYGSFQDSGRDKNYCNFNENKQNIILIGDSHAQQLFFGFNEIQQQNNEELNIVLLMSELMRGNWNSQNADIKNKILFISEELKKANSKDVIIFSITSGHLEDSVYGSFIDSGRLINSLVEVLRDIFMSNEINSNIILMLDTPHLKTDVARICSKTKTAVNKLCNISFIDFTLQNKSLFKAYQLLIEDTPQIKDFIVFDPTYLFCNLDNVCSMYDKDKFILIDGNHINIETSNKLVKSLYENAIN